LEGGESGYRQATDTDKGSFVCKNETRQDITTKGTKRSEQKAQKKRRSAAKKHKKNKYLQTGLTGLNLE
jgi:hypothetical protein